MKDKNIYLVFSKTGTWLSRLISLFSSIKYPHVSISFDSGFSEMYSFGRINPDNPFSGGFVKENLYDGVFRKSIYCECRIFKVRVTEDQYKSLQKYIEQFSIEKDKYKYSFLGLCGILINIPIKRQNYYFCSQFVSEILIKSKILKSGKAPELMRTDDLFMIKNKELFYEGYVNKWYSYPAYSQVSL